MGGYIIRIYTIRLKDVSGVICIMHAKFEHLKNHVSSNLVIMIDDIVNAVRNVDSIQRLIKMDEYKLKILWKFIQVIL